MPFNKLVTPLIKVQNTPPNGGKPFVTSNLRSLASLLVQESATEIIVTPYNKEEAEFLKSELSQIPKLLKKRVKIGDENLSLQGRIKTYLKDVYDIAVVERSDGSSGSTSSVYSHPQLEFALRLLALACNHKCEVDIPNFKNLTGDLQWLKTRCRNEDGKSKIDNILGIINCYEVSSDDRLSVMVNRTNVNAISSRIDELLSDSVMQEISELQYSFGLPSELKTLSNLKDLMHQKIKKILQNKTYSKLLGIAPQIISLYITQGLYCPPEIPIPEWQSYNPPIVNLADKRIELLRTIPNLGFSVFLLGDAPMTNIPRPGTVGAPTFAIPGVMHFDGKTALRF